MKPTEIRAVKVLVVDDEEVFRNALETCLKSAGHEVIAASNGKQAQSIIGVDENISLVISDIRMAPVNGIELLHFIKKEHPALPVILMTGFSEISETQEAFTLGANAFLAKPFKAPELLKLIPTLTHAPKSKASESDSVDTDYCRLLLEDFISGRRVKFDIYVRLSETKYVKIAHEGEDISLERIKAYKEKGIKYLYLTKEDFRSYVGFNVNLAQVVKNSDRVSKEKRLGLMKHTGEVLLEQLYSHGIDKDSAEFVTNAMDSTVSVMTSSSDALALLTLLNSHGDHLYRHSVGVSMYAVLIARGMQWQAQSTLFKVAVSGLMHDIGKKEIDRALLDKPRNTLAPEELRLLESHPMRGLDLLSQIKGFPTDALQVVVQHHENCSGTGYPYNLSKAKIHPFARLVALADKFCNLTLAGPNGPGIPPKEALACIQECYAREFDMTFFPALAKLFSDKQ